MIGVLGSSGFLGKNLCNYFDEIGIKYVTGSRTDINKVDALDFESIKNWIEKNQITSIINLAAYCGGIGLNERKPFDLWYSTTLISANILKASLLSGIDKIIMTGSVCSYAEECPTPFSENDLMKHGFPEPTNRAYGVSKLNGLIGAQAMNNQYGIDIVNLVPVNMYGPHDNFDLENSHVIPALIKKVYEAIENNHMYLDIWGTGEASREFLFVEDCARAIAQSLDIKTNELINIGTGDEIKIKDLAEMIKNQMGYKGIIKWDYSKPNGQMKRKLNIEKANTILKWKPKIKLEEGINKTIQWFYDNVNTV
jgi:GDP-L-fucose synthase